MNDNDDNKPIDISFTDFDRFLPMLANRIYEINQPNNGFLTPEPEKTPTEPAKEVKDFSGCVTPIAPENIRKMPTAEWLERAVKNMVLVFIHGSNIDEGLTNPLPEIVAGEPFTAYGVVLKLRELNPYIEIRHSDQIREWVREVCVENDMDWFYSNKYADRPITYCAKTSQDPEYLEVLRRREEAAKFPDFEDYDYDDEDDYEYDDEDENDDGLDLVTYDVKGDPLFGGSEPMNCEEILSYLRHNVINCEARGDTLYGATVELENNYKYARVKINLRDQLNNFHDWNRSSDPYTWYKQFPAVE